MMNADKILNVLNGLLSDAKNKNEQDNVKALEEAIKAVRQAEWILCNERMPKKHEKVLISIRSVFAYPNGQEQVLDVTETAMRVTGGFEVITDDEPYYIYDNDDDKVMAWKPMPESYQGNTGD